MTETNAMQRLSPDVHNTQTISIITRDTCRQTHASHNRNTHAQINFRHARLYPTHPMPQNTYHSHPNMWSINHQCYNTTQHDTCILKPRITLQMCTCIHSSQNTTKLQATTLSVKIRHSQPGLNTHCADMTLTLNTHSTHTKTHARHHKNEHDHQDA